MESTKIRLLILSLPEDGSECLLATSPTRQYVLYRKSDLVRVVPDSSESRSTWKEVRRIENGSDPISAIFGENPAHIDLEILPPDHDDVKYILDQLPDSQRTNVVGD